MIVWEEVCNLKMGESRKRVFLAQPGVVDGTAVCRAAAILLLVIFPVFLWDASPPAISPYGLPGAGPCSSLQGGCSDSLGRSDWLRGGHIPPAGPMILNPETFVNILGMGKASSLKGRHKLRATLAI